MLVILVRDQACRQSNAGRSLHQLPDCDPGRSVQDCGSAEPGQNSAFVQDRPRGAAIKCALPSRSTRHSSAYRRRLFLRSSTRLGTYGFRGGNVRLSMYPQPTFGKEPCGNPTAI